MVKKVGVGFIGAGGNVGSASVRYLVKKHDYFLERGYEIFPASVCDIEGDKLHYLKELDAEPKVAGSSQEVIDDPDVRIVVEAIGKNEESRDIVLSALENGKSVVTPNKQIIAQYSRLIFDTARRYGQDVGFEPSVMGSVPVIRTFRNNTDDIVSYSGILNATSNLIIDHLSEKGWKDAFQVAIGRGAAEPDDEIATSPDILGKDTANKNKILAMLSFGYDIDYRNVIDPLYLQGIQDITKVDLKYAEEFGFCIKLLGQAANREGRIEFGTYPFMVPKSHGFATVKDVNNALQVESETREIQFYSGKGAEPGPTSVAVVDDIFSIAKKIGGNGIETPLIGDDADMIEPGEQSYKHYIRFDAIDKPGVLSKISGILGDNSVSIEKVMQQGRSKESSVPIIMFTHEARTQDIYNSVKHMEGNLLGETLNESPNVIRVMREEYSE